MRINHCVVDFQPQNGLFPCVCVPEGRLTFRTAQFISIVPPGLGRLSAISFPAINRWAIVNCPAGARTSGPRFVRGVVLYLGKVVVPFGKKLACPAGANGVGVRVAFEITTRRLNGRIASVRRRR